MRVDGGSQKSKPAGSTPPKAIHFDIGRITLHGYTAADRLRFTETLRGSLAQLARANPQYGAALKIDRMDAGEFRAGTSPERAARQVAERLFGRIRG